MVFCFPSAIVISVFVSMSLCTAQELPLDPAAQSPKQNTAEFCATCHSAQVQDYADRTVPILQGQYPDYLYKQLEHFAQGEDGPRNHPLMTAIAQALTTEEKKALASYYSSQPYLIQKTVNDSALLEKGRRLYLGGDVSRRIPACAACHHPSGRGNQPALYPFLAHQNAEYLIQQLEAYRSQQRLHPVMNLVAHSLSDEQIQAVAYYIQGLQP